jgi:Protein of unknown function (DUF2808)
MDSWQGRLWRRQIIVAAALISLPLTQLVQQPAGAQSEPSAQFNRLPLLVESSPRLLTNARQTYAVRIQLPADAGAALEAVQIRQPEPEQALDFALSQTTAFQNTAFQDTARSDRSIPIQSVEQIDPGQIQITFVQPIQPGTSLTILLKPRHLPTGSNQYPLIVSALPVGADLGSELGQQQIETCRSRYDGESDGRVLFWDLPPEFNPYIRNHPCQR